MLGLDYPIIQGGMAWVADASLAAAVSDAGALGIIAAGNAPPEWLREQIRLARAFTDRPFGVNIMLMSQTARAAVDVVCEERVSVVTTGAGSPGEFMSALKAAGVIVIPVVASSAQARRVVESGADAVIAEGYESGGHVGELTTMALVPQVADAVDVPVIAAGGIGDGRGVAAALCLGADGVQLGTRFLVATECTIHPRYKARVLAARDSDTAVTGRSTGHPVRCLKNRLVREFQRLERAGAPPETLEALGEGKLALAAREGDVDNGSVMAGQIAGLVRDEASAEEIVRGLMAQAAQIIEAVGLRFRD
jgi:enoyl-[acyl-carrier protein] reductase II